ncbi:hypothetical protein KQI52_04495, partial [bacterium]|nr:hypothetical protein [bacterium]
SGGKRQQADPANLPDSSVIEHYMKYYDIINQIYKMYKPLFEELRKKHNETYKYDIRILDKLLWMIGNPK